MLADINQYKSFCADTCVHDSNDKGDDKNRFIVVIPEDVQEQIASLPADVREELDLIIDRMTEGDFSIEDESTPLIPVNGLVLKCSECGTDDIMWLYDGDDEYVFTCNRCGESGWLTKQEFRNAQRDFSDMLFEHRLPFNDWTR